MPLLDSIGNIMLIFIDINDKCLIYYSVIYKYKDKGTNWTQIRDKILYVYCEKEVNYVKINNNISS